MFTKTAVFILLYFPGNWWNFVVNRTVNLTEAAEVKSQLPQYFSFVQVFILTSQGCKRYQLVYVYIINV